MTLRKRWINVGQLALTSSYNLKTPYACIIWSFCDDIMGYQEREDEFIEIVVSIIWCPRDYGDKVSP
jgi:hypothetical protein